MMENNFDKILHLYCFSYCAPLLCEEISVFHPTENVPVKEGGDAVLFCNFGIKESYMLCKGVLLKEINISKVFLLTDAFGVKMVE